MCIIILWNCDASTLHVMRCLCPQQKIADVDIGTIFDRLDLRNAVECGHVEDAIEKVNHLNPEILDTNPQLYFHLQQLGLIELIRAGKVEEALEFAQEKLAPSGKDNPALLEELERTMALMAFENASKISVEEVKELLNDKQRRKTANELDAAVLKSLSDEKCPSLPSILKMLMLEQNQLDEKVSYPRINNIVGATLEGPVI